MKTNPISIGPRFAALAFALTLTAGAFGVALTEKTATLEGTATCAKCGLHQGTTCQSLLHVTDREGKIQTYYLTSDLSHKAYFCGAKDKPVTVMGTVREKDGKHYLTPESISAKP